MDVDLYSESQADVKRAVQQFRVQPIFNDSTSPSPVLGYAVVKVNELPVLVQFLNGAFGITNAEKTFELRQDLDLEEGFRVSVMHPLHLLQSKAVVTTGKPGRENTLQQHLKHLNMAALFTLSFILDIAQKDEREAINLCKRVLYLSNSFLGIRVFRQYGIRLEEAVPTQELAALSPPKLGTFLKRSYPSLSGRIEARRLTSPA